MTRFAIDTVQLNSVGMAAAVTLRGVGSAAHRLSRTTVGPESGAPYDEARFITEVDDEFNFGNVIALESLLENVSLLDGKCVSDDVSHPGVKLFGAKLDRCGTAGRGTAGTAASVTAKKAHVLITQITANKNQLAMATLRCVNLLKTGETRPTVTVFNATLPASYVDDEAFALGPVHINGFRMQDDALVSVTLETGLQVQVVKSLNGYPADILMLKRQPRLRISLQDPIVLADGIIPYEGLGDTTVYVNLLKMNPNGGYVAETSAAHIQFEFHGNAYIEENLSGGGANPASAAIVVEGTEGTGGASPVIVTTGTECYVIP